MSSPISALSSAMIDVGNAASYAITGLDPGTYFFAVTAYNNAGPVSKFSREVSKIVGAI